MWIPGRKRKTTALHLEELASWGIVAWGSQGAELEESLSLEGKLAPPLEPNLKPRIQMVLSQRLMALDGPPLGIQDQQRTNSTCRPVGPFHTPLSLQALFGSQKWGHFRLMKLEVLSGLHRYMSRQNLLSFILRKLLGFLEMWTGVGGSPMRELLDFY